MTIEELPRYERLPGEYFVYEVEGDPRVAAGFLAEFGTAFPEGRDVVLSPNQYREVRLRYGDYVTFCKRDDGSYSIITYAKADFESRYRRVGQ